MTQKDKTLWMGNIEPWMTKFSLISILNKMKIFPTKINIKKFPNKRSCAFLEFLSHEIAEDILQRFNGKYINNIELKFNWVKKSEDKKPSEQALSEKQRDYILGMMKKKGITSQIIMGKFDGNSINNNEMESEWYYENEESCNRSLCADDGVRRDSLPCGSHRYECGRYCKRGYLR